jgi:hypothetical protein
MIPPGAAGQAILAAATVPTAMKFSMILRRTREIR